MAKNKKKPTPVEEPSSSEEEPIKNTSKQTSSKKSKSSLITPCVVQFSNSVSAPTNISNIHFTLVRDEKSKSFLYGESKSMQFSSNIKNQQHQGSKYLLAVVKPGKNKPSIIEVPEFYVVSEDSKQNIERKEALKRELEQGGVDSVQPEITYKQFFEKRVLGGTIVKNDALTLFNSKRYTKIQEKRKTTAATDLRKTQLEELQALVGKTSRASALSTMQQYLPKFNVHTSHLHEILDLKKDLLFSEQHLIDQFEEKHCRNKSLQKVWSVLEDATEQSGALGEDVNVGIKSTSDFTNLPNFLQTYFGAIIDNKNWNAVCKEKRKKKKKGEEGEDEVDPEEEEKNNEEQFSTFLQTVAADIPSISHYYMVMLGIFQISQAKRFKDHAQNIIRTCYVNGTLDRKQVKKAGKKEKEENKKDTGIESVEGIFPNAPLEAMKKHPHLFLPKSSKALQDLILRFATTDVKTRPKELRHLNTDRFTARTLQVRIVCHLLASALLMCNFYLRKELVFAIQQDTKLTTEKLLMCFNSMGVVPDTQSNYVRKMVSRMSRGSSDLTSLAKEDENKKQEFNPLAEVNFYLNLSKLKQNFGVEEKKADARKTKEPSDVTTQEKPKKDSKKKTSKVLLVEDDDDEVQEEKPKKTDKKESKKESKKDSKKDSKKESKKDSKEESENDSGNESVLESENESENESNKRGPKKSKKDEDIMETEENLNDLLSAFQTEEDDEEFEIEEDEPEDKEDEMVDLVEEDEEMEDAMPADSSDDEQVIGSDDEESDADDDEEDDIGGLLNALGGAELDMEGDSEEDEDLDDEDLGIKEALGKKRKSKDEDDDEAGVIKSNKKRKHDFEQDIEEGEDDSSDDE